MKFYYTYVLRSLKDKNNYCGSTDNLERRLKEHAKGETTSTKYRRPLKLIYYEAIPSEKRAREREKYFLKQ